MIIILKQGIQTIRDIQRSQMQTDLAQRDPAHGYPDDEIVVPQIQDETVGVFFVYSEL